MTTERNRIYSAAPLYADCIILYDFIFSLGDGGIHRQVGYIIYHRVTCFHHNNICQNSRLSDCIDKHRFPSHKRTCWNYRLPGRRWGHEVGLLGGMAYGIEGYARCIYYTGMYANMYTTCTIYGAVYSNSWTVRLLTPALIGPTWHLYIYINIKAHVRGCSKRDMFDTKAHPIEFECGTDSTLHISI